MNLKKTKRLYIRRPKEQDVEAIYRIQNTPYVLKYNGLNEMNKTQIHTMLMNKDEAIYIMELIDINKVIGAIFVERDSLRYGIKACSISCYLDETYAHQGYMKEAMQIVIDHIFYEDDMDVISARVLKDNTASMHLVESLGFQKEGVIRRCLKGYQGIIYDDMIYSILKEEYVDKSSSII